MKIIKDQDNKKFILENSEGQSMEIGEDEFWEIVREGTRFDTEREVKNYLGDCDKIQGMSSENIRDDEQLMESIIETVMTDRIGKESDNDIYDAANKVVNNFIKENEKPRKEMMENALYQIGKDFSYVVNIHVDGQVDMENSDHVFTYSSIEDALIGWLDDIQYSPFHEEYKDVIDLIKDIKESRGESFIDDYEKMFDFQHLSKEEFLLSYSYLTEDDYDATCLDIIKKPYGVDLSNNQSGKNYFYCQSLDECVKELEDIIDIYNVAASDMYEGFGDVYLKNQLKYQISYNGRVRDVKVLDEDVFLDFENGGYYQLDENLNKIKVEDVEFKKESLNDRIQKIEQNKNERFYDKDMKRDKGEER